MTFFYKIEAYHQGDRDSDDVLNSYDLYTTFEKACDAIDTEIRTLVNSYNQHYDPIVYTPPTRETMKTDWRCIEYYELAFPDACYVFLIKKLTVAG